MRKVLSIMAIAMAGTMLVSCANGNTESREKPAPTEAPKQTPPPKDDTAGAVEVPALTPRAILAADGKLVTINLKTGQTISETASPGVSTLYSAGDLRHILATQNSGFKAFDSGLQVKQDSSKFRYYESNPRFNPQTLGAGKAIFVSENTKSTLILSKEKGLQEIQVAEIGKPEAKIREIKTGEIGEPTAAATLTDGSVFVGGSKGISVIKDGKTVTKDSTCAEVQSVAAAAGNAAVAACKNGSALYKDGKFTPLKQFRGGAITKYFGSEKSPLVLGIGDGEVHILDSVKPTLDPIIHMEGMAASALGRTAEGHLLLIKPGGTLNVMSGENARAIKVDRLVAPWQGAENAPILRVAGNLGYVLDRQKQELLTVDLNSFEVTNRFPVAVKAFDMAITTGK